MRYLFSLILILGIPALCYADRVILLDETGKHLMTSPYSDTAIEAMKKDAQSSGLDLSKVTVKKITEAEWLAIEEEQIKAPAREKAEQEKLKKKQKEATLKTKFGWTDEDLAALKAIFE